MQKLWVLKTVEEADRALRTVDHYEDTLNAVYNYDSKVANFKRIKSGDNIILIDKEKVLGFAKIESISEKDGEKIIRKCPECGSSTIDRRKNLVPEFRCNKGHTFPSPIPYTVPVTRFAAHYQNSFISYLGSRTLSALRPYYTSGYNQNMSMQLADMDALSLFKEAAPLMNLSTALLAHDGREEQYEYEAKGTDERQLVNRQIKERRGQQKFRNDLFKRYGQRCMITGCRITDILEAAHINPYRGINDHHITNGLILRADIHTLFDLNLIGIEPESLTIHFHAKT